MSKTFVQGASPTMAPLVMGLSHFLSHKMANITNVTGAIFGIQKRNRPLSGNNDIFGENKFDP